MFSFTYPLADFFSCIDGLAHAASLFAFAFGHFLLLLFEVADHLRFCFFKGSAKNKNINERSRQRPLETQGCWKHESSTYITWLNYAVS